MRRHTNKAILKKKLVSRNPTRAQEVGSVGRHFFFFYKRMLAIFIKFQSSHTTSFGIFSQNNVFPILLQHNQLILANFNQPNYLENVIRRFETPPNPKISGARLNKKKFRPDSIKKFQSGLIFSGRSGYTKPTFF